MAKVLLICLAALLLSASLGFCADGPAAVDKPIWLAITKPVLEKELRPLAEMRRKEGFDVVVTTRPAEDAIKALPRQPAFIVLVGDEQTDDADQPWRVPARRMEMYRWRQQQPKHFVSDMAWGCMDKDMVPQVPVGRIPARTPAQLASVVKKILAYQEQKPQVEDLQLPVWVGAAGYGEMIDSMSTGLLLSTLQANAPPWARHWVMSGNATSPFCGRPEEQPTMFNRQIAQGGFLAVMMGHGGLESFFAMNDAKGKQVNYLAEHAQKSFAIGRPACPLVIMCCNSGNFSADKPCLAKTVILSPAGPAGCIAATTESHPLTNYFTGVFLLDSLKGPDARLGTVWLSAQKAALKANNILMESVLQDVEGKLEDKINVAKLRRDQVLMYAILGDPATPLKMPQPLKVTVDQQTDGWHWKAEKPQGADALDLSMRPLDCKPPVATMPSSPEQSQKLFEKANAAFEFTKLYSVPGDQRWEGTIKDEGVLRLVTICKDKMFAAAIVLRLPATRPTASNPK